MTIKRRASSLVEEPVKEKKGGKRRPTTSAIDDSQEDVFIEPFSKEDVKTLQARGIPYADLPTGPRVSVSDFLTEIQSKEEGGTGRRISPVKQLRALNAIMSNPLRGSYVLCISSYPSDLRAKALAATIVHKALQHKNTKSYNKPMWHRVYGGLGDPLRDKSIADVPSLLVISNLVEGSSAFKTEKVRDLLEKYSHIPRIVVYGGEDPLTLFEHKLHSPLKAGIFLGPGKRKISQL